MKHKTVCLWEKQFVNERKHQRPKAKINMFSDAGPICSYWATLNKCFPLVLLSKQIHQNTISLLIRSVPCCCCHLWIRKLQQCSAIPSGYTAGNGWKGQEDNSPRCICTASSSWAHKPGDVQHWSTRPSKCVCAGCLLAAETKCSITWPMKECPDWVCFSYSLHCCSFLN